MKKLVQLAVIGGLLTMGVARSFGGSTAAPKTNYVYGVSFTLTAYVDGATKGAAIVTKDVLKQLGVTNSGASLIYKNVNGKGDGSFYYRRTVKGTNVDVNIDTEFAHTNLAKAKLKSGTQEFDYTSLSVGSQTAGLDLTGLFAHKGTASGTNVVLTSISATGVAGTATFPETFTNAVVTGSFNLTFSKKE